MDILLKCLGASLVPQSNTCPLEYGGGGIVAEVGEEGSVVCYLLCVVYQHARGISKF